MAGGTDVPLDAAGEPGAVEREVGGLEHRVAVEQFTAGREVDEGVHAAAEAGQHGDPQVRVLHDDRLEVALGALPPVAVPDLDGEQRAQRLVPDLARHVAGQPALGALVQDVDAVGRAEGGQRVVRAQRGGGQGEYGAADGGGHKGMEHAVPAAAQGFRGSSPVRIAQSPGPGRALRDRRLRDRPSLR
ncbi:hypothetical protein GCM10020254_20830 [Streptomyces goshikiensis]